MNAGGLLAVGAALVLVLRRRSSSADVAPVAIEPPPPPVEPTDGPIVRASDAIYLKPLDSDTAVALATQITGDPSRWRELRDAQPSRKRRDLISKGMMSSRWWLRLPPTWYELESIPDTRLTDWDVAILEDPLVASAGE